MAREWPRHKGEGRGNLQQKFFGGRSFTTNNDLFECIFFLSQKEGGVRGFCDTSMYTYIGLSSSLKPLCDVIHSMFVQALPTLKKLTNYPPKLFSQHPFRPTNSAGRLPFALRLNLG